MAVPCSTDHFPAWSWCIAAGKIWTTTSPVVGQALTARRDQAIRRINQTGVTEAGVDRLRAILKGTRISR